jgi:NAD(P)-dependent dehydrogenase (short-subunit alcohol dehydrogenase family)
VRLENRVAVITGADGPVGSAIALRFAREGAYVVLNDIVSRNLDRIASEVVEIEGGKVLIAMGDATNRAHVDRIVREAVETFGHIDVLVTNAGDDEAVAVQAASLCAEAVLPAMRDRRAGRVIMTSPAPKTVDGPSGDRVDGIIALTRRLALGYAECGVTVNCVVPGATMRTVTPDVREAALEAIPMGRLAEPREIAAVYTFLASDEAAYVTGQVLCVDGGLSLVQPIRGGEA